MVDEKKISKILAAFKKYVKDHIDLLKDALKENNLVEAVAWQESLKAEIAQKIIERENANARLDSLDTSFAGPTARTAEKIAEAKEEFNLLITEQTIMLKDALNEAEALIALHKKKH
jgi:hypothetical protein